MRHPLRWVMLAISMLLLAACDSTKSAPTLAPTAPPTQPALVATRDMPTVAILPSATPLSPTPTRAVPTRTATHTETSQAPTPSETARPSATVMPEPTQSPTQTVFAPRVEVVATNLEVPWALAFAPDGRLFFTERPGRIRVIVDGVLQAEPVADLTVQSVGEGGLLGLTLDPGFADTGHLYVMYTYASPEGARNRVSRFTFADGRADAERVILEDIPGALYHDGGRLLFGPDGKLYVATGDARNPDLAQRLDSVAGKILRVNPDGSIPDDNPYPNSLIYSYGHRNPQGLAWQPQTNILWSSEHGPSGEFGLCCRDEINRIVPGANYGWPNVTAQAGDARYVDPVLQSGASDTWAPASATFYDGAALAPWRGNLFYGALRGQHLGRVALGGPEMSQVIEVQRLYEGAYGRIRDVAVGPDGTLYFTTSNLDGRAQPGSSDDRILRVVPGG